MTNKNFPCLSQLPGWRLAEPGDEVVGKPLLSEEGERLGAIRDLRVDQGRMKVVALVLDDGRAFAVQQLQRSADGSVVVNGEAPDEGFTPVRLQLARARD